MIEKYVKASTLLGITTQLYSTRMNQILGEQDLNVSQFFLLNHLLRNQGKQEGISDLTQALEMNQPAVTKIVQKLAKLDLVEVKKDEIDSRKKWVSITVEGQKKIQTSMQSLGPDVANWFEGWSADDLDQLIGHLAKLASWLDENRLR